MPSSYLILWCPLLLLPSIFPNIRNFSNESTFHIRWSNYWSFSLSISPSNEYSGLISFRIGWFDLLAVQRTFKTLLQHHSLKASVLWHSAFFMVQLSYPYMINGKTIALTIQTCVVKVMSLLFNMLSRLVIAFLPGTSVIYFLAAVTTHHDFGIQGNEAYYCFHCFSIYFPWSDGTRCHDLSFFECWVLASFFTLLFHLHQEAL